jgi:hypothetical protein
MDALSKAQAELKSAEHYYDESERRDGSAFYREQSEKAYAHAAIWAAVAQAEQLKRIADLLEERYS